MFSLIWKEWHEQSWKLGFTSLVLGALAMVVLHARVIPDESMALLVCVLGVAVLPVLTSAGLVAAQRHEGNMELLLALPIRPGRILFAKMLIGMISCALPLALAAVIMQVMAGEREMTARAILQIYGRAIIAALALFTWIMAFTVKLPTEARAGLLGIGIIIFWVMATTALERLRNPWIMSLSPLGLMYQLPQMKPGRSESIRAGLGAAPLFWAVLVQAFMAGLLYAWASHRLSKIPETRA